MRTKSVLLLWCMSMLGAVTLAQPRIQIDVAHPAVRNGPTMYGMFFEDTNFGADGGL